MDIDLATYTELYKINFRVGRFVMTLKQNCLRGWVES